MGPAVFFARGGLAFLAGFFLAAVFRGLRELFVEDAVGITASVEADSLWTSWVFLGTD